MDITIKGNINIYDGFSGQKDQEATSGLLRNDASFNELTAYLQERAGVQHAEADTAPCNPVRAGRRPGCEQLRKEHTLVARISAGDMSCEVYENGYGIYDNGDRRTVVRISDCPKAAMAYYPSSVGTEPGEDLLTEAQLAGMAWYLAIMLEGEDRIERNLTHPISTGARSDRYAEDSGNSRYSWSCGARFQNPEDVVIYKEEMAERYAMLSEKQREVYQLYYLDGYTQEEIAEMLLTSQQAVSKCLKGIRKKISEIEKNFPDGL